VTVCVGIDAGSRAIKIALVDSRDGRLIATACADQGIRQEQLAMGLLDDLLAAESMTRDAVGRIVATGYARRLLSAADTTITEITCHARGVRHLVPEARTIVEIGGQDSKLIWLEESGRVRDFAMNDRCAAGTGRFLEMVAERLEVELGRIGDLARRATHPAIISSMCVVFAETEIIGLLAGGTAPADIVAGVQAAIATRIVSMAGRRTASPVLFTGGVARIDGMDAALAEALHLPVAVAPHPQFTGALGAALLARERA